MVLLKDSKIKSEEEYTSDLANPVHKAALNVWEAVCQNDTSGVCSVSVPVSPIEKYANKQYCDIEEA